VSYKTVTKLVIGMVASHDAPTFWALFGLPESFSLERGCLPPPLWYLPPLKSMNKNFEREKYELQVNQLYTHWSEEPYSPTHKPHLILEGRTIFIWAIPGSLSSKWKWKVKTTVILTFLGCPYFQNAFLCVHGIGSSIPFLPHLRLQITTPALSVPLYIMQD